MPRRQRCTEAGSWSHITNRGIARRPIFERQEDILVLLEFIERAVELDGLEVHAFVYLTTHFHMLARCPEGGLGVPLQRVQNGYARWYNRSRRRDGPVFRGRYHAKRVTDNRYRAAVVAYIDRNSVDAGLVTRAADYPYGSARDYCSVGPPRFPWLTRDWVEGYVLARAGGGDYDPHAYERVFGRLPPSLAALVELRLERGDTPEMLPDPIDAAPEAVLDWMRRKAHLADGHGVGDPLVLPDDVDIVLPVVAASVRDETQWRVGRRDAWNILRAGLLRDVAACTLSEIAQRLALGKSAVDILTGLHRELLQRDAEYAERAARAVVLAMNRTWAPVWRVER
jgi:REP element-mobilizing transposase RayT